MARRIVELVGPAGAGKTTLAAVVARDDGQVELGLRLGAGERRRAHATAALRFVPACLRSGGGRRWFSADEIRAMGYLEAWYRRAVRETAVRGGTVLLDHGPVFRLALLDEFGPAATSDPAFRRWWDRSVRRWAGVLDIVVALDASDEVLARRIRARDQRHVVKDSTDAEIAAFLARYRSAYARVLDRLVAAADRTGSPLRVLHVTTDQETPAGVAAQVSVALREARVTGG